jgi:hypothetical protein
VKTRKRHRLSAEATVTGPEKTDVDKRDPKRMKESQSPRTTTQKLIAEDELVPMLRFISARELAERKAREAKEKDERRRVIFAGPSQDQEMKASGVQRSTEPTPTTSHESMATATSEMMSQDGPPRAYGEEMTSDESQTTVPYDTTVGDDMLIADEEMQPQDEWNASYEQQVREEREKTSTPESSTLKPKWKGRPPSQERGRDTVFRTTPETYKRREIHEGLPGKSKCGSDTRRKVQRRDENHSGRSDTRRKVK